MSTSNATTSSEAYINLKLSQNQQQQQQQQQYYNTRPGGFLVNLKRKSQPNLLQSSNFTTQEDFQNASTQGLPSMQLRGATSYSSHRVNSYHNRIPKKLTLHLGQISQYFVSELSQAAATATGTTMTQDTENQEDYQERMHTANNASMTHKDTLSTTNGYYPNRTLKQSSRCLSTASIQQIKRSAQAIQSYKAASRKLKVLLTNQEEMRSAKNSGQKNDTTATGKNRLIKTSSLVLPRSTFSHGFSQIKDFKGYFDNSDSIKNNYLMQQQQQEVGGISNQNINSIFNIQGNKNDAFITETNNNNNNIDYPINNPQVTPYLSSVPMEQKKQQELRIIQQINMSKFSQNMETGMEEDVQQRRQKCSELQQSVRVRENQLQGLRSAEYNIERNEIHSAAVLTKELEVITAEANVVEELIYQEQRRAETLRFMEKTRNTDLLLSSKPILLYSTALNHLSRFLTKITDSLYTDSKHINQIYLSMTQAGSEVQRQEQLLQDQWRGQQFNQAKELEAERLAEFESTMREIAKSSEKEVKRQLYEKRKQIKQEEQMQKNALALSIQEKIYGYEEDFRTKNEGLKETGQQVAVTSYKDLLDFCVHVKLNTEQLRQEENFYKESLNVLESEVKALEKEAMELRFSKQTKSDELIIAHNQAIQQTEFNREDDYINLAQVERQYLEAKRNGDILEYDISKKIKQEQLISIQLAGMHQKFVQEIKKSPPQVLYQIMSSQQDIENILFVFDFQYQVRIPQKLFDVKRKTESIESLTASILSLQQLIADIKSGQVKSSSNNTPINNNNNNNNTNTNMNTNMISQQDFNNFISGDDQVVQDSNSILGIDQKQQQQQLPKKSPIQSKNYISNNNVKAFEFPIGKSPTSNQHSMQ